MTTGSIVFHDDVAPFHRYFCRCRATIVFKEFFRVTRGTVAVAPGLRGKKMNPFVFFVVVLFFMITNLSIPDNR